MYTKSLLNGYPLEPPVTLALGQLYVGLGNLIPSARQIQLVFEQVHERDIARRTKPRGDESKWNL